jgi:hypothetical protein
MGASTFHRVQPDALRRAQADSALGRFSDERLPLGLGQQKNDWPSPRKRPSLGKRSLRALIRYLITLCIGVSATLAWQSYGDVARQLVAHSSPVLGWVAPPAAPLVQVVSDQRTPAEAATPSLRQSMEQLTAKLQDIAGDIATLQATQQSILQKVSLSPRQPSAPARSAN